MKHDLEDMLEIIKRLEKRIIVLERAVESITSPIIEDRWYWLTDDDDCQGDPLDPGHVNNQGIPLVI